MVFLALFCFSFLSSISNGTTLDTTYVHFQLDMNEPINLGWFDSSTEKVGLRGDLAPLSWSQTQFATKSEKEGFYHVSIPFLLEKEEIDISFKIKVDGKDNPEDGWQKGRNHSYTIKKYEDNVVALAWNEEAQAPPPSYTGIIDQLSEFNLSTIPNRDIVVYLPHDYHKTTTRYPVLYMHDGQHIFDASISGQEWHLDEWAEELIANQTIEPMIIVGISNTERRMEEYTPTRQIWENLLTRDQDDKNRGLAGTFWVDKENKISFKKEADTHFVQLPGYDFWQILEQKDSSLWYEARSNIYFEPKNPETTDYNQIRAYKKPMGGNGKEYAKAIVDEIKPFVDENYRTLSDSKFTAIGGSSLGGLISMHIGLEYSEIFGHLLVVSPSVWWDNKVILRQVENSNLKNKPRIWLDAGTAESESMVPNATLLHEMLISKGWSEQNLNFQVFDGARHNEKSWAERAGSMLEFLDKGFKEGDN